MTTMKSETVATTRTGVNLLVYLAVAAIAKKITGTDVSDEDLLPWMAGLAVVYPIFYRLALFISEKWKAVGVILFGLNTPPIYKPPAPPVDNAVILPPEQDKGYSTVEVLLIVLIVVVLLIVIFGWR